MIHITRANSDGVCFCECEDSLMAVPDQLDCPWCGCGWLLTCDKCGKAFTFGKAIEVDGDLEDLVRKDLIRRGWEADLIDEMVQDATAFMEHMLSDLDVGAEYVYFDGILIPVDFDEAIEFEGIYASHELEELPHVAALENPAVVDSILANQEYWTSRETEEHKQDAADDEADGDDR